jgi:hypothetical protein
MPAPAVASWEGDPVMATAEDAVLTAEAREGYARFTLTTARSPIDRVQWLVTGENVTIGALEPREVGGGVVAEVSGARTVHHLTATGNDLCIKVTFSFMGSNQPLFLEACQAELLALANNEERQGSLKSPGDYSLRGNPDFSIAALPPDARAWYDKVRVTLEHPSNYQRTLSQAASDNIYHYSRDIYTHLHALLTLFRVTGDLNLLDAVDEVTQTMRAQLADGWRGTRDRTDGTRDGYLNWVDRYLTNPQLRGKDLTEYNEARTHSILAMVAYTFQINRDLVSPSGIDYGERADFWKYYLTEHFEAKWRKRNDVGRNAFPFIMVTRTHTHSLISLIKYHYFMYQLTDRRGYINEARRLSDEFWREVRSVETPEGSAFVWRRVMGDDSKADYLMPTTYARYVLADAITYHLEGFYRWGDEGVGPSFANTVAQLMMDHSATGLARDVGGGISRAGYSASSEREWDGMRNEIYALSSFALIAPWDSSGKVARISAEIFENVTNGGYEYRVHIPAGMFLYEMLRQD